MDTQWHFFATVASAPPGFTWQWQKKADHTVTSRPFNFYFDCVTDARANGYIGPLPPGPKVPLRCLPHDPDEAKAASAAVRSSARSKPVTMPVVPMSKTRTLKRKAAASRAR